MEDTVKDGDSIAVWFSCGAASATALKLTCMRYGNIASIIPLYNPVIEEDKDNLRFKEDVEQWVGIKIQTFSNPEFPSHSAVDVWEKRKYMSGIHGAPCTEALKKSARRMWEDLNHYKLTRNGHKIHHVFGFTNEEEHRHIRRLSSGDSVLPILIEENMNKQDCFDFIREAGIKLPRVYSESSQFGSGYPNANCIGCVKATSPTYWNHVRETRPEVFEHRAEQSRRLGVKLVRVKGERLFLDELSRCARGQSMKTMKIECGILCEDEK